MQKPGYYALPLSNVLMYVSKYVNKMTLFSKPNDRIIRLDNQLYSIYHYVAFIYYALHRKRLSLIIEYENEVHLK